MTAPGRAEEVIERLHGLYPRLIVRETEAAIAGPATLKERILYKQWLLDRSVEVRL